MSDVTVWEIPDGTDAILLAKSASSDPSWPIPSMIAEDRAGNRARLTVETYQATEIESEIDVRFMQGSVELERRTVQLPSDVDTFKAKLGDTYPLFFMDTYEIYLAFNISEENPFPKAVRFRFAAFDGVTPQPLTIDGVTGNEVLASAIRAGFVWVLLPLDTPVTEIRVTALNLTGQVLKEQSLSVPE